MNNTTRKQDDAHSGGGGFVQRLSANASDKLLMTEPKREGIAQGACSSPYIK